MGWKYKIVRVYPDVFNGTWVADDPVREMEALLFKLGQAGWELTGIHPSTQSRVPTFYLFKRPAEGNEPAE